MGLRAKAIGRIKPPWKNIISLFLKEHSSTANFMKHHSAISLTFRIVLTILTLTAPGAPQSLGLFVIAVKFCGYPLVDRETEWWPNPRAARASLGEAG